MESSSDIGLHEFKNLMNNEDVIVIDVRTPEELCSIGRIPKAINIPRN